MNIPLTALTFCQHFYSLFKGLEGKSARACVRLHLEGSLKAAFSPAERGGKAIVPAETMGAAGRHAAVRT